MASLKRSARQEAGLMREKEEIITCMKEILEKELRQFKCCVKPYDYNDKVHIFVENKLNGIKRSFSLLVREHNTCEFLRDFAEEIKNSMDKAGN